MDRKKQSFAQYDIDHWQWEFLRRNKRYQRAYRVVEWLKKRLDRKFDSLGQEGWITIFGDTFGFYRECRHEGWGPWIYTERWAGEDGDFTEQWYLDLPSPDASSAEYKSKILRTKKPRAVVELGKYSEDDDSHPDVRAPYTETKFALLVDARYDSARIVEDLKAILKTYRPKVRNRVALYESYLAVWDRFQRGLSAEEIAAELEPDAYAKRGGRGYSEPGEKSALSQQMYDHRSAAESLIEAAFPAKQRTPKIKK